MATILSQIYEEDFRGFSYGFRPGRSQHDALDALSYPLLKKKVNYILDADVRSFFDNLDKGNICRSNCDDIQCAQRSAAFSAAIACGLE